MGGSGGVGVGRDRSQTWGEGGWLWERVESENVCEMSVALWAVMTQKGDPCAVCLGVNPGCHLRAGTRDPGAIPTAIHTKMD